MILGRYIFREILSSALLGIVLSTFVVFLQKIGQLFELLLRSSAKASTVGYLFLLVLPHVLALTIPFGVLVGILIGLGRMSSDGEITAMRAAGVSSRKVVAPVLVFAFLAMVVAAAASVWLKPWAIRETYRVANKLAAEQLTADIQPRIFEEQIPNKILYVGNVKAGPSGQPVQWQNVFIADLTAPEDRKSGLRERADGPLVTVARQVIATPDPVNNRIQLSLRDATTHEVTKEGVANDSSFPRGEQALPANPPSEGHAKEFQEMDTNDLPYHARHSPNWIEARIELYTRLSLPLACIALALAGIPLGASSRKAGRSGGYVTAVFLAFFCYHLAFITLSGLARQRTLPVEIALWLPNFGFFVSGIVLLARMERPGERDLVGSVKRWFGNLFRNVTAKIEARPPQTGERRFPLMPQLVDTYILSQFFFYFGLLLASFVLMTHIYTFFELLSDIVKTKTPMARVLTYLFFLTPKLIYDTLPLAVLVSVLVTFGVMTKYNEVTAFKASGVSLYRLAAPVILASMLFSVGLFAFDYYYVPEANKKQDAIRNEIKGRPVQTYLRPDRKWIFGTGPRIYYYKHFDVAENVMVGVIVYELEPETFKLMRQISAERAQWQPSMGKWIFQNGWRRDIAGKPGTRFEQFEATTFAELNEPPDWFLKEAIQDKQMNFWQLDR
ncbi:MAG: LptF/LptG family permease, partial [Bryobacteraceae bacterium]